MAFRALESGVRPVLQIGHLTITHKKDLRVIVKDLSFVLNPGDKAVLIGEEGNGKSHGEIMV